MVLEAGMSRDRLLLGDGIHGSSIVGHMMLRLHPGRHRRGFVLVTH